MAKIPIPGDPVSTQTSPPSDQGWLDVITNWTDAASSLTTLAAFALVALLLVIAARKVTRKHPTTSTATDSTEDIGKADRIVTRVTAVVATAVVAQGMWDLFTDVIPVHWTLRLALFAFIEAQLIAAFRRIRRYMRRTGSLGNGVFTIVGLEAISGFLAAVHAAKEGSLEETLLRVLAAAIVAHMLLEELREERDILRHRNPDKYQPLADWKEPLRRIAAAIGLVEPTTLTVGQVATLRRIDRLARLLDRYHTALADTKPGRIKRWWITRLQRQVIRKTQAACKYINLAEDPNVRQMLLRRLSIVRGVVEATKPADGQGSALWAATVTSAGASQFRKASTPRPATEAPKVDKASAEETVTVTPPPAPAPQTTVIEQVAPVTVTNPPAEPATATVATRTPAQRPARNGGGKESTPTVNEAMVQEIRDRWTPDFQAEVERWTEDQAKEYATQQARAVLTETGNKTAGMHRYFLIMHAVGHDPKGTPMAESVEAAGSLGRRLAKQWSVQLSAQLMVAEVEQALASNATTPATNDA